MWRFGRVVVVVSIWVGVGALCSCGGVSSKSKGGAGTSGDSGSHNSAGSGGASAAGSGGQVGTAGTMSDECNALAQEYGSALEQARACDPALSDSCSLALDETLSCGCAAFVNQQNAEDIALAQDIQMRFVAAGCAETSNCGLCPQAMSSFCNGLGRCVAVTATAPGAGCRVDGVDHASGTSGIPSPSDCNTCTCQDGGLGCTLIGCESKPCPAGHVLSSQCIECSAEGCRLMEFACLPSCPGICDGGTCVDGVCKAFCE